MNLSFKSNYSLLQKVDSLPFRHQWIITPLHLTGDIIGKDNKPLTEQLKLWHWSPVDIVKELIGNPVLRDDIQYAPIRLYEDREGKHHVYEGTNTCDWWWDMQVSRIHCLPLPTLTVI